MSKLQIGWSLLIILLYALFWNWYGGNGEPLSQSEGNKLLEQIVELHGFDPAEAPAGSIIRNMQEMMPNDDGKEFYAVNLETLNKSEEGRKADIAYGNIVLPLLIERAGHPVFISNRAGLMLGQYGDEIDRVAVVRYRSLRDLLDMINDPKMVEGNEYKTASLDHTEVIVTRPIITFVQLRLIVGLILFLVAAAGWMLLGRKLKRRESATPDA